ncbi:MAG: hypothetical protein IEMM0008_0104 [bacterium]|nr:MAG: hypothetical protein IEMM0008_0104 [bacterium]
MAELDHQRIREMIDNLEGVLKTSGNADQRKRVTIEIHKLRKELERNPLRILDDDDEDEDTQEAVQQEEELKDPLEYYDILKNIPVQQTGRGFYNRELNEIYTFIKYFEDEHLGMLGEYHLKLDYDQSLVRDNFYSKIHDLHTVVNHYANALEKHEQLKESLSNRTNQKLLVQEEYRNLLTKLGDFFRKLYKFVDNLVESYNSNSNLVLNPHDKLSFDSSLGESQILNGCTVIEGIQDLHRYLTELLEYLNLPDIK